MNTSVKELGDLVGREYKEGFVTDIESDTLPPGLDESVVRFLSSKKSEPQFVLDWRLDAFHRWQEMDQPDWAHVHYAPIDYQGISYYSAPKRDEDRPQSLDEVDPKLLETYEKLGIPLEEQKALAGVAVDAVFDSVSVATTFKDKLAKVGVIFCPLSEALINHPDLVRQYLGSVVPATDNFYAALNSAVFTEGSFVYIPKGVRCPMELSTYFRINALNTGQFERTLIVADEGSYVSYLEGCTAPMATRTSFMLQWSSLSHLRTRKLSIRRFKTGIPATKKAAAAFITLSQSAALVGEKTPRYRGRRWKQGPLLPGSIPVFYLKVTVPWANSTQWR